MSIQQKIIAIALVPVFGIILLGLFGWVSLSSLSHNATTIINEEFIPLIDNDIQFLVTKIGKIHHRHRCTTKNITWLKLIVSGKWKYRNYFL